MFARLHHHHSHNSHFWHDLWEGKAHAWSVLLVILVVFALVAWMKMQWRRK